MPPADHPIQDSLPGEAIHSGKLRSLQLEGILYTLMPASPGYFSLRLPSGILHGRWGWLRERKTDRKNHTG
ncbi:hypothetical protein LSAT2_025882 [Lamellibrachia satsuma]|nr:hypothetical protein LSAT2_025882 [Lamellibrachia satsuma]